MNVASTVLTRQIFMTHKGRQTIENMSSQKFTMSNKFYAHKIVTFFEDDIVQTTRVYEDRTLNAASKVFTRKNVPPHDIIGTHLLTNNDPSRVFARKNAPPPPPPWRSYIIGTNLLTKFHEDLTINVASRVLTRKMHRQLVAMTNIQTKKNAPPPLAAMRNAPALCSQVIQDIIGKNLLSKFHKDRQIDVASRVLTRKNAPPNGGHFHEDQTINVASIVKNPPPLGSHVFQAKVTIFELLRDIIETNLPTKFHED
ncbi:hypothetical protein DPMN_166450 [Dreissena polymorpha]|uniref:Uncharacterized protein n=1 Tax=Dreissena polymorpha TaxID=45954 RepID=A0A9D4IXE2_DREPO|nr:hypothetical protein DPMN_166450 [Dreissena polymorpha]